MVRNDDSDEQLMLHYRNGDADAFEVLYRRHKDAVFRYLLRKVNNRATAEELFQEVWMNLIRRSANYEVRAKFTTLLYRIAYHRSVDYFRSTAYRQRAQENNEAVEAVADESPGPQRSLQRSQQIARFKTRIAQLPDDQRDAFLLHQEAGLGIEVIASITGVGKETAKSRLRYALARLRREMSAD